MERPANVAMPSSIVAVRVPPRLSAAEPSRHRDGQGPGRPEIERAVGPLDPDAQPERLARGMDGPGWPEMTSLSDIP